MARELCLRTGSKAILPVRSPTLAVSIVIGLDAVACSTGDTLAKEQAEAASKEGVLKALSTAATSLRAKLGESLASVQKFDVPVEATTPSLEALKAYSMGITTGRTKGDAEAIPFMKRAIELDPNFAMAYAGLAVEYANLGQASLAAENARKAYDLRDRVSERERYRISAFYFQNVTGEVEKATEAYELWAKSYPRDMVPHANLGVHLCALGQYDKAIAETEAALRLEPTIVGYGNLAGDYINVNRLKDARQTIQEAQQKNFDGFVIRADLYALAFLSGDTAEMERQVAWAAGRPGEEDQMLNIHADTQAYYGRLEKARDLARRASDSAVRSDAKETGAQWLAFQALREAEAGQRQLLPGKAVARALALAPGRDVKVLSALALARSGETAQSKTILEALQKSEPTNTYLKVYWFPVIEASHRDGATGARPGDRRARTLPALRTRGVLLPETAQCIPRTFAAWLTSPKRTAPLPPPNSRSSSIIPESCRTSCSARSPTSNSPAPMPSPATPPKPKPPTRISSPSGKTPTPTSPS